jgi:prepilin-type processing-associated H-X9-DG protein
MEQNPLYQIIPPRPGLRPDGTTAPNVPETALSDGRMLRAHSVPYGRCPSDPSEPHYGDLITGNFNGSYTGSIGSQRTPSANGSCNTWLNPAAPFFHYEKGDGPNGEPGWYDHGNTTEHKNLSGVFGRLVQGCRLAQVKDGLSNTLFVGEIMAECHDHDWSSWHYNQMNNAHASTSVPPNDRTTCYEDIANDPVRLATKPGVTNPNCGPGSNWNYSWGFKSGHPGGVQFAMGDGSVRFVPQTIDYLTYQRLGGKAEGGVLSGQ